MKVELLPSAVCQCQAEAAQFLTTFLINDVVAIDAGSLGLFGSPQQQARVRHVFLSHTHVDHTGSLPIFLENAYEGGQPVVVHGSAEVLDCLRRDVFNERLWPDFIGPTRTGVRFLELNQLDAGASVTVEGLRITSCPVNHAVPTAGFLIEGASAAVVIPSDTGPTEAIWECARQTANLKAVFLEASFPDAMGYLAEIAKHLTPSTFAAEVRKLNRPVAVFAVHIKARFRAQVIAELRALNIPGLDIAVPGRPYHF